MIFPTYKQIVFIFLLFSASGSAERRNTLIVGYGDHDAAPYAIENAEVLNEGIIKDIATEISHELDINLAFVKTPRKRTERYLENNTIHLILITNPAWLSNSDKLQWSEPLFIEKDILVVNSKNKADYRSLADLRGLIIGTIRGYKYPNLQPYFDKEYFIRYDVSNLTVNFIRLALQRVDALVDADILINYHLKKSKNVDTYRVLPLLISEQNIQAALSPQAPISITQLNQVIEKLKKEGVIEAILEKYQVDE